MSKLKLVSFLSVAPLLLGLCVQASAATVSVNTGPFVDNGSFNSGVLPAGWVASGYNVGIATGNKFNVYAAPTGDTTAYAYVGPGGSIMGSFAASPISSLSLYWGSADSYNNISFTDSNGTVTAYGFGGAAVPGLSLDTDTSAYVTFADTGAAWTSVTFSSNGFSFEFDDISTTAATAMPEPSSMLLLASGLVAVGAGTLRRQNRK